MIESLVTSKATPKILDRISLWNFLCPPRHKISLLANY